ncbi:DUF1990 family protein [Singulisphaera sp. PoT]|uniref:DUF1990 family protein n=1 Tax=Singulisphaera sp. PoT TaxID=3411797 RepID=UPI003BF55102
MAQAQLKPAEAKAEAEDVCVVSASQGIGSLFERNYSAVITDGSCSPEDLMKLVREKFISLAPQETAAFRLANNRGDHEGLEVGDVLEIRIALFGMAKVRVIHVDDRSITLGTVKGHPEAGRITFGASKDPEGRLVFRIVSRTRASGVASYLGFFLIGKQMQSRCWIRFIDRTAKACGGTIEGRIRVCTTTVEETEADRGVLESPTIICKDS